MNPVQVIARKRDGRELSREEIASFMQGFAAGVIPEYQMSALAMAIYLKGMNAAETAALTEEMLASGQRLTWTVPGEPLPERDGPHEADDRLLEETDPDMDVSDPPTQFMSSLPHSDNGPWQSVGGRDTVELDEEPITPQTLLLDGSEHILSDPRRATGGRDTVELDGEPGQTVLVPVARGAVVDKHSTGGLGDKVSLILAPLLACCGLRVPMISGRGLGATGGTLDKLESIPGFRTNLTRDEIRDITERVGCVITGATADLAPADRKLYALRDVTATVASIPLITASIMSKKLSEGLDALVLDVKFGSGAFMKTLNAARKLAASLVETGQRMGVKTSALLTNMDQPLGRMVGNTLEVDEAVDTLAGRGPDDLWEVTRELCADLLLTSGRSANRDSARQALENLITSGEALAKFREMVVAQGGKLDAARPRAESQFAVVAPRTGYVSRMNAETLGLAIISLGGGRRVMSDSVDHAVGLEMLVRIGDQVRLGQPLVKVHCHKKQFDAVKPLIRNAISIRPQPAEPPQLVVERVS